MAEMWALLLLLYYTARLELIIKKEGWRTEGGMITGWLRSFHKQAVGMLSGPGQGEWRETEQYRVCPEEGTVLGSSQ